MASQLTSRAASDFNLSGAPATAERAQPRRSSGLRRLKRIAWNLIPPLTFVLIIGCWSAAIQTFKIPAYLLPGPGAVFQRVVTDAGMLWLNTKVTLTEIVLGFGLTVVTAIPLGLAIALSPLAKQTLYPPIMLLQLVPKIAVAPLFLVWLGFGIESKVLLTLLMTFFPLLLASISGFQILDTRLLYLTRSMGRVSGRHSGICASPPPCRSSSPASRPPRRLPQRPRSSPNSSVLIRASAMCC